MTAPPEDTALERVRELLERINEALGLDGRVEVREEEGEILGAIEGEGLGLLIGRHGQTIDAVQHLAYKIASRGETGPRRVVIDAAGYRDRRREVLHRQAEKAATDALRTGRSVALDAMSATERKVVHEHLKDHSGVETYSEGQEPDRRLVVAPLRR
jgi:spoIIIJ-associated protein